MSLFHEFLQVGGGVVPGSQNYTTPGSYSFVVPDYNTLTVDVKGAGGGGGESGWVYGAGNAGTDGGSSTFQTSTQCLGNGGTKGTGGNIITDGKNDTYIPGTNGTNGTASGPSGSTNTTGGGAAGGAKGAAGPPDYSGGNGAAGGRCQMTFTKGAGVAPAVGATITVTVGTRGTGGTGTSGVDGSPGSNGSVSISWA